MGNQLNSLGDFIRKYGILGSIAILTPFVMPYINSYLMDRQKSMIDDALDRNRVYTFREVRGIVAGLRHDMRVVSGTKVLDDEQALYIMKTAVGFQSIHKIKWIVAYLTEHYTQGTCNPKRAKNAIKVELYRQSHIYINGLNLFSHPVLGRLGDYVANNFPMNDFLERVYCIACDKTLTPTTKGEDILSIMLSMQNDLWDKARGVL